MGIQFAERVHSVFTVHDLGNVGDVDYLFVFTVVFAGKASGLVACGLGITGRTDLKCIALQLFSGSSPEHRR